MTLFELTIDGRSWNQLSVDEQSAFNIASLTTADRDWFAAHWLLATASDVTSINAALPHDVRVEPLVSGANRYLGSDLLTDCEGTGSYGDAGALIRTLPIVSWSPPEDEG